MPTCNCGRQQEALRTILGCLENEDEITVKFKAIDKDPLKTETEDGKVVSLFDEGIPMNPKDETDVEGVIGSGLLEMIANGLYYVEISVLEKEDEIGFHFSGK